MAVPTITSPGAQQNERNKAITPIKVKASETPLTATKWKVEKPLPAGLTSNAGSEPEELEITGTPTTTETVTVGLVAHNVTGSSAEVTFTWQIFPTYKDNEEALKKKIEEQNLVGHWAAAHGWN